MHPITYFGLLTALTPIYIPFLLAFTLLSNQNVTIILKSLEKLFQPLRIILLTPGVVKSHFITHTHWLRQDKNNKNDEVVLILGGNATTAIKAYDDVYAKLVSDDKANVDCACIPLQTHFTEQEYIQYLMQECENNILVGKNKISLYGHSLGGALCLQLALALKKKNPNLQIDVFVSRSFDKLWHVSIYKYGKFFGQFFEKVFSGLWQLQSQKALHELTQRGVLVRVEQTEPDEVLGEALLRPALNQKKENFNLYKSTSSTCLYPDFLHSVSQAHLKNLIDCGLLQKKEIDQQEIQSNSTPKP